MKSNSSRFKSGFSAITLAVVLVALAGCATSRSELRVQAPVAVQSVASDAPVVVIRTVTDERVFEEKPRDPSTPSLGFGGAANATAEVRARAIGRKRNGYGKAMGDVLLEPGQTVEALLLHTLKAGLQDAGFQVRDASDADATATVIDVRMQKFWSWFQPGFWAIKLHAQISTELSVEGGGSTIQIDVNTEDSRQMATESAWLEIIQQALVEYQTRIKAEAGRLTH